VVEVLPSREATVGALPVRRALPRRAHRTVGAWCFADHMGPLMVTEADDVDIAPHPHIGLQTVTWLLAGEIVHRDSLGSEQTIRPGQLNLMTAGHGVSHSEESTGRYRGEVQGMQLWVAQPEDTRHGAPAFEHHAALPQVQLGDATATVLVGELADAASPARRDTDHLGAEIDVPGSGSVTTPLRREHEHALVLFDGSVIVDGVTVRPGNLVYLGTGRDELTLHSTEATRMLLLGGVPFPDEIVMWWNFVARTREEIDRASTEWQASSDRFGQVASTLPRIPAPVPSWQKQ
jgi:redox-sensitive bicupin YhaK (pirin superfamily)